MKYLFVFNTCGPSQKTAKGYIERLSTIIEARDLSSFDFDIMVSDCCSSIPIRREMQTEFGERTRTPSGSIPMCEIDDAEPVFITFNHSAMEMEKRTGRKYDYVVYLDSGLSAPKHGIDRVFEMVESQGGEYAYIMVSANNDNENNDADGWKVDLSGRGQNIITFDKGQALNLHCMFCSRDVFDEYGKWMPDMFINNGSENFYWYVADSIGKSMGVIPPATFVWEHKKGTDGPAIAVGGKRRSLHVVEGNPHHWWMDAKAAGIGAHRSCPRWFPAFEGDKGVDPEITKKFIRERMFIKNGVYENMEYKFYGP